MGSGGFDRGESNLFRRCNVKGGSCWASIFPGNLPAPWHSCTWHSPRGLDEDEESAARMRMRLCGSRGSWQWLWQGREHAGSVGENDVCCARAGGHNGRCARVEATGGYGAGWVRRCTLAGCGEAYRGISGQQSCSVGRQMSASATTAISWIATLRSESACDTGEVCPAARQSNALIECCVDCKLIQTQCVENDGSVAATIAAAVLLLEKMTHSCEGD